MAKKTKLKKEWDKFAHEYIIEGKNGTKAYLKVFPKSSYDAARTGAARLLAKANIRERIDELSEDLEKTLGISKQKVVLEFMNIAFSKFSSINRDWLTLKEFNELTPGEMACISEVKKETITMDGGATKETVKVKLYDKQRALENLSKLMGYNDQVDGQQDFNISFNIVQPE